MQYDAVPPADLKTLREFYLWAAHGHEEAATCIELVYNLIHAWDDLVDGDKESDLNTVLYTAMVTLPRDPFYQRHFNLLNPVIESSILSWLTANELESTDSEADKEISFILRSAGIDFLLMVARICGGWPWAVKIAPFVRRDCHSEGLAGYKANLLQQFADAAERKGVPDGNV